MVWSGSFIRVINCGLPVLDRPGECRGMHIDFADRRKRVACTGEGRRGCQPHAGGCMDTHVSLPKDCVKAVVNSGLDVFVWTIDDIGNCERLYRLGVTAITSNSLTQEPPQANE